MSLEAITTVIEAENNAKSSKIQATADSKAAVLNAEIEGKAAVSTAIEKAQREILDERTKTDGKSMAAAATLASETENKKAAMRMRAESRLDKAAALIVERIVNG